MVFYFAKDILKINILKTIKICELMVSLKLRNGGQYERI